MIGQFHSLSDAIIAYESGEATEEDAVALFQVLVDTGLAWVLQGSYGRTAMAMAEAGVIELPPREKVTV